MDKTLRGVNEAQLRCTPSYSGTLPLVIHLTFHFLRVHAYLSVLARLSGGNFSLRYEVVEFMQLEFLFQDKGDRKAVQATKLE